MPPPPQPSSVLVQAASATDPKQRLITAVRSYVHMDNLVESFNVQATNARELRNKHETDAIDLMKQLGLQKSTLQISGGTLQLTERRTPSALSWGYLEREVPAWATSAGLRPNQAAALLAWLHDHREIKTTEVLKKGSKPIAPQ
jgi:hypothetical protein